MLAVAFKWTPGMEGYLRAMSVPVWTVLIFYLGKSAEVEQETTKKSNMNLKYSQVESF